MTAYFTRDSVCAGDDDDAPHARQIELPGTFTVEQLVRDVIAAAQLPSISGGKATWCIASNIPLAVIAQQSSEPKFISMMPVKLIDLDFKDGIYRLHFSYFEQQEPQIVHDVLRRLRLRAE